MEKLYEWCYKVENEQHWHICSRAMTKKQAKRWFEAERVFREDGYEFKYKRSRRIKLK